MLDQRILDILTEVEYVANLLKGIFVGKDELIELLVTSAIAQEHLLIVGPPGTAKSELIKRFALLCSGDPAPAPDSLAPARISYFEYLLTRFTEPNEIFGPVDIATFREGKGAQRSTENMLPRAEVVFLDEVFKANSAILNALLTVLNERIFYNGSRRDSVPLICAIGATNAVPDEAELAALYDRFLLRVWTDNVEEAHFPELFDRGWKLAQRRIEEGYGLSLTNITTTDDLRQLHRRLASIDLTPLAQPYREVVRRLRTEGIQLSDRRVVSLLKLMAASALRHKRVAANPGDFWVLRHVWNDPEQIAHLQNIVNPYVEAFGGDTWSAERRLEDIQGDLDRLDVQREQLKTDTDFVDALQQHESLRRELLSHSSGGQAAPAEERAQRVELLGRIEHQIDGLMQIMEKSL